MSLVTERFIANLQLVDQQGVATAYFRDFLARVDGFIQQAGVVSTWGGVGGTLSDQTDLQNALDNIDTSQVVSGTFADARISEASVTQHEGALSISFTQLTGVEYVPPTVRDEATDPYTLALSDANTVIRFTALDADVTIPQNASVAFPVGTEVSIRFAGTGTQTLTTTGLTINGTVPSLAQHLELKFRKVATDEWDLL